MVGKETIIPFRLILFMQCILGLALGCFHWVLSHAVTTEMPSLNLSLLTKFCCLFLAGEKLSKLADGEKATTEELLVLLEEGTWDSIQQQGVKRFVSCDPSLFGRLVVVACASCHTSGVTLKPARPQPVTHPAHSVCSACGQ